MYKRFICVVYGSVPLSVSVLSIGIVPILAILTSLTVVSHFPELTIYNAFYDKNALLFNSLSGSPL
jgi:hypothetical protein